MNPTKLAKENKKETGRWSDEEHQRFILGIMQHGKDWKKVEEMVGTRSGSQVRSHAQKFFNKLQKQDKEKKSGEVKIEKEKNQERNKQVQNEEDDCSESFNEIMKGYDEGASISTPLDLISMIKNNTNNNKTDLKKLKKQLGEKIQVIEEECQEKELDAPMLLSRNSYKSMSNILSAYENVKGEEPKVAEKQEEKINLQDESFLIFLTKKYKKYFSKEDTFKNLIDFGNSQEVNNFEKSIRKRSFTLPEGVQGDEDDLNERKKRIITESYMGNMTQKQKSSFKLAMERKKQEAENQDKEE